MQELVNKKCFISIIVEGGTILKFRDVLIKDVSDTHITFIDDSKGIPKIKIFRKEDIQEAYEI